MRARADGSDVEVDWEAETTRMTKPDKAVEMPNGKKKSPGPAGSGIDER